LTDENRHPLSAAETVRLIEFIAQTNHLFYLHPSFGHFFERFYLEPSGAIYKVIMRDTNSPEIPSLSSAVTDTNETFWTRKWKTEMAPLVPAPVRPPNGLKRRIQKLGITAPPDYHDRMLAEWYSLSLDSWGVALQQQGRWKEARLRFEQALQLNTNNLSAQISLSCNTNLQSGRKLGLAGVEQLAPEWGSLQRLGWVLNDYGSFDEPVFCYLLGCAYLQNGLPRQAVQPLERTQALAPGLPGPELALAEVYTQLRMIDRARPLINHLRDTTKKFLTNSAVDLEVALLEANSWLLQTNLANARNALQSVLRQHPDDARIANRVLNTYLAIGDFTNALRLVKAEVSKAPDDVSSLTRQAAILIQSGNAAAAIPILTHILTITNSAEARISRATAELISQNLTAAESHFRELEKSGLELGRVNFGLATIAELRHDTNQTVRYLQSCLVSTPPGTMLWRQAKARLQAFEGASPSAPTGK
jgi:tetratricopeptide (TPR) repeat protein